MKLITNNKIFKSVLMYFRTKKKIKTFIKTKKTTNKSTLVSLDIQRISGVEINIDVANKLSLFFVKSYIKK